LNIKKESIMRKKGKKKSTAKLVEYVSNRYKKSFKKNENIGIKKQYLKTSPICKVTFRLPQKAAPEARKVTIVGDFNNWSATDTPLKKLKNGTFSVTLDLEQNREYQFRYLIDSTNWENDWKADKYVQTQYGDSENSVVIV
jgi:1,4-alpha-glucan branching enzyme